MKTSTPQALKAHAMAFNPVIKASHTPATDAAKIPAISIELFGGRLAGDVVSAEFAMKLETRNAALLQALQSARLDLKHIAGMDPLDSRIPRILAALIESTGAAITRATL